jgi:hypothetical protein
MILEDENEKEEGPYYPIMDYINLPNGAQSNEYKVFKQAIQAARDKFHKQTHYKDAQGVEHSILENRIPGELAIYASSGVLYGRLIPAGGMVKYTTCTSPGQPPGPKNCIDTANGVLYYEKCGSSPYPAGAGQSAYASYAVALRGRNSAIVSILRNYLTTVKSRLSEIMISACTELGKDSHADPGFYFAIAKKGIEFAYNCSKTLRSFQLIRAQYWYARSFALDNVSQNYINGLYDSWKEIQKNKRLRTISLTHCSAGQRCVTRDKWEDGFERVSWAGYNCNLYIISQNSDSTVTSMLSSKSSHWEDTANFPMAVAAPHAIGLNGKYPLDKIQQKCLSENQTHPCPGILCSAEQTRYNKENELYKLAFSAEPGLIKAVNDIIETYKAYLPYRQKAELGKEVSSGQITSDATYDPRQDYVYYAGTTPFLDQINAVPQPKIKIDNNELPETRDPGITVDAEARLPHTFTLDASQTTDDNKDTVHYRWVITAIPEDGEAKSKNYILGEVLKTASGNPDTAVVQFTPDLAGQWKITLEVNDGKEWGETIITIKCIRHILWIQHVNAPYDPDTGLGFDLELYDPDSQTKPLGTQWGGPYYLEVAHEKAEMFLNYNDDGMPVDNDYTYVPPAEVEKYCFKIGTYLNTYRGEYGSTNIDGYAAEKSVDPSAFPDVYHKTPGTFSLKSSSDWGGSAWVSVALLDSTITDFVLPIEECPYYQKQVSRTGYYNITQWSDYYSWINTPGLGFMPYPAPNEVPDWMERRAAEVLNGSPMLATSLDNISKEDNKDNAGEYWPGSRTIQLNPHLRQHRYNLPETNGYGFYGQACLDNTTIHEAHHAYYYWNVMHKPGGKSNLRDGDGDNFPDDTLMFNYLWDSSANTHGALGPSKSLLLFPNVPLLPSGTTLADAVGVFSGDNSYDLISSRVRIIKLPKSDYVEVSGREIAIKKVPSTQTVDLGQLFPDLPIQYVMLRVAFFMPGLLPVELEEGVHFKSNGSKLKDQKTKHPVLEINFIDPKKWKTKLINYARISPLAQWDQYLYIRLMAKSPAGAHDYDASWYEPAEYTGKWN